ncbi:UNKNOWN [Stylonychia lemnae]|uniref:Protein kinase domain-containing protein n=1 Tax=Stylonychia lemnae TaxID=5949 RepID=A0A078A8T5_STYLE|nr:UNKNOWN [Stylonychia lemnae]|eukprot:CDW77201.1 UNKNOWN [Stylonychia lemnae]
MHQLNPPRKFKTYTFDSIIGSGAYGIVCKYMKGEIPYAIKLEKFGISSSLLNEKNMWRKIKQKNNKGRLNVPNLIDSGVLETEDKEYQVYYLVYEYLGQSLFDYFIELQNSSNAI